VRLNEIDRSLSPLAEGLDRIGSCSLPLFLLAFLLVLPSVRPRWQPEASEAAPPPPVHPGLRFLALGSILVWVPLLPFTQPEQQRRYHVEQAFRDGQVDEGLAFMNARERSDFPPHWEPPPKRVYGGERQAIAALLQVLTVIAEEETSDWVREI